MPPSFVSFLLFIDFVGLMLLDGQICWLVDIGLIPCPKSSEKYRVVHYSLEGYLFVFLDLDTYDYT